MAIMSKEMRRQQLRKMDEVELGFMRSLTAEETKMVRVDR